MTGPRSPSSGRRSGPFRSPTLAALPWPSPGSAAHRRRAAGTASRRSAGPAGSRPSWLGRSPTGGPCSTAPGRAARSNSPDHRVDRGATASGDEVAPIDLRIDHVYLVSCKYESDILANASPGRLFDGLLATSRDWDRTDWYEIRGARRVQRRSTGPAWLGHRPRPAFRRRPSACSRDQLVDPAEGPGRAGLSRRRRRVSAYAALCRAVSAASAASVVRAARVVGHRHARPCCGACCASAAPPTSSSAIDRRTGAPARFRIADPWDWRDQFELRTASS